MSHHATTIAHAVNARHGEWPTTRHVVFLSCFWDWRPRAKGCNFLSLQRSGLASLAFCSALFEVQMQRAGKVGLHTNGITPQHGRRRVAGTNLHCSRAPASYPSGCRLLQVLFLTPGQRYPPTPMLRKPRRRHMGTRWESRRRNAHNPLPSPTSGRGWPVWCWGRVAGRQIPCRATNDVHVKPPVSPRWWE